MLAGARSHILALGDALDGRVTFDHDATHPLQGQINSKADADRAASDDDNVSIHVKFASQERKKESAAVISSFQFARCATDLDNFATFDPCAPPITYARPGFFKSEDGQGVFRLV
jgi:hypothetical protein